MEPFAIAVKAFIVEKGKLLILKRSDISPDKPGVWDIPGGRLDPGENPFDGLKREVKEETGLDIEILNPLEVAHFVRDDGQKITNIRFICKASGEVRLSKEHTEFQWASMERARELTPDYFHIMIDRYEQYFQNA